jgi:UPF0042 nucleotide-binding protein
MSAALELAVVTGLSGAGRSTAAKALEDLGWFVVDNLPPTLLETMADLGGRSGGTLSRIAVVVDVRGREFFADVAVGLQRLRERGVRLRVLFLEANDDALVRRFEGVRRPHPLQGDGRLVEGITRERDLLRDLRGEADLVIDTSDLNVHALRSAVDAAFGGPDDDELHASVVSFGYKYGLPVDADLVVDCRFLPNPHWVDELRPLTGRDAAVRDYVLGQPDAQSFLARFAGVLETISAGYAREGKRYLTLAVGCTGGKHRSVAIAEELTARLLAAGADARVVHRDLGRE